MSGEAEFKVVPIHEAIARAKAECSPVGKDGYNKQQDFKFRGVDAVVNGAARALNRYGVVITTKIKLKKIEKRTYQSKYGANMLHVLVPVRFEIYGADGSGPVVIKVVGEAADSGDKVVSKATSVAYRIMLIQLLNLPTGDPDPDSEVHEREQGAATGGDPWANGNGRGRRGGRGQRQGNGEDWRNQPVVNRARSQDGDAQPQRQQASPAQALAPPAADDPALGAWAAKLDEITSLEDVERAMEELDREHEGNHLDSRQYKVLKGAVAAKGERIAGRRPAEQSAEERGAKPVPTGKGDDGEWVTGFMQRLTAVTDSDALGGFQGQIAAAARIHTISPAKATELSAAVRERRTELQGMPA